MQKTEKPIICIKIGGKPAGNNQIIFNIAKEIKTLLGQYSFVFIHGGGSEVTAAAKQFGIEAQFVDGKRITTPQEMKIVDAVLCGKINKQIVRQFYEVEVAAVGISGSDGATFTGVALDPSTRTGKITKVDTKLLEILISNNFLPVVATTSISNSDFLGLNINADDGALAIASEIGAAKLIFISDIEGVLKDGKVIPALTEETIKSEIESGVISGGMIPKVTASLEAIKKGAKSVVIATYTNKGDLQDLINQKMGTIIS